MHRRFGMELEIVDCLNDVAEELNQKHLSYGDHMHDWHCGCSDCSGDFGELGNLFKVQSDSSCGGEIISAPLAWGDDISPATYFTQLQEVLGPPINAAINHRCGIHIHVGVEDLNDRQLGRVYELVHHYEAILFRLACGRAQEHRGYRNGFNYCRPLSAFDNQLEVRELALAKSEAVKQSPIARQKYIAANLMPVDRLGTVELRLWESTKMAWRMELFAKTSVALVQRATSKRPPFGKPLHLGETAPEDVIFGFIEDLDTGDGLVDERFAELVIDQWTNGPTWQREQRFIPLPHYNGNDRQMEVDEDPDEVHYQLDSHGNQVPVLQPEPRVRVADGSVLTRHEVPEFDDVDPTLAEEIARAYNEWAQFQNVAEEGDL